MCAETGVFSRRSATGIRRGREPWVETHGYHHEVAPRLLAWFPGANNYSKLLVKLLH